MNYLQQVQTAIEFVEHNLEVDIDLAGVANAAGMSQWHFQRIFKALTNETLKTYIRARRMANALDALLDSNNRILDVALAAGYESQESFTRAFQKAFHMSPGAFRETGDKNLFLKKVQIDTNYLQHLNNGVDLVPEMYIQKPLNLIGMKTEFYGPDSEKNNIAEKLPKLWGSFLPRLHEVPHRDPDICFGVVQITNERSELLSYYATAKVYKNETLPSDMIRKTVPEALYARFAHRGKPEQLNNTINYIYANWLLQSHYRHTYGPDLEFFGSEYIPDSSDSVIYYAIPVCKYSDE